MPREDHRTLVVLFLEQVKELTNAGHFTLSPRKKNLDALARLSLRAQHCKEIVLGLSAADYCHTSQADGRDEDGWVFGIDEFGAQVYIKLKIDTRASPSMVVCVSFHEAEKPLTYPHR